MLALPQLPVVVVALLLAAWHQPAHGRAPGGGLPGGPHLGPSPPPPLSSTGATPEPALRAAPHKPTLLTCPKDTDLFIYPRYRPSRGVRVRTTGEPQRLELPPMVYLVTEEGVQGSEIAGSEAYPYRVRVEAGLRSRLSRYCLDLVGTSRENFKAALPQAVRSDLPAGTVVLGVAGGRRLGEGALAMSRLSVGGWTGEATLVVALTDRLTWPTLPALAYRFDQGERVEWIPWAGMYNWGFEIPTDEREPFPFIGHEVNFDIPDFRLAGYIGAGLDVRVWLTNFMSLQVSSASTSVVQMSISEGHRLAPNTWRQSFTLALSLTLPPGWVTVNLALGTAANWLYQGQVPTVAAKGHRFGWELQLGSFHYLALRRQPLLQIHLTDFFYAEVYASGTYNVRADRTEEIYMLGIGGVL